MLDTLIQKLLPGGPVYVRISSRRLSLREPSTGSELSIEPILMIGGDGPRRTYRLQSQPPPAGQGPVLEKACNGFDHPRTIISDFAVAEKTLQMAWRELVTQSGARLRPKPIMILHPLERVEGGLTQVERRALTELGMAAGAIKVYVWEGRQLSDPEIEDVGLNDDARFSRE